MVQDTSDDSSKINRRRILQGIGATGIIGVAGCLGDDDDDDTDDTDDDVDTDDDAVDDTDDDVDTDDDTDDTDEDADDTDDEDADDTDDEEEEEVDIEEGGTLRVAVAENPASFDPPYSTDTTSTLAQGFIFEGLTTTDIGGNVYPWLAESYELVDSNEVERLDYEEYMRTEEAGEEGALEVEEQVLITHPEDLGAGEGEEVRILTTTEAADAVEDGTFGMHYQYELREGVEFHNGEEMTAEDVVASFARYENSDVSAQTFDSILHVEEEDDYTVSIYAQIPDAEAERELPGPVIMPADQAELDDGAVDPREGTEPVGTGAYEFTEFEDAQYYTVTKNENYWVEEMGVDSIDWFEGGDDYPDGPVIDEVDMEIVPDDATRSGALQNDEVDLTYGLTTDTLDDFDASEDFQVASIETGGYEYFQYPVNVEPWDDERLRQAANHLVPREAIVENVLAGWARPAWTPVPEIAHEAGTVDHDALEEELRPMNEYDPEGAEEMIEEVVDDLGLETPIEVQLEVNADNDDRVQMVELVAESMQQTGYFEVEIETYEWNTYTERVLNPEYAQEGHIACIGLSGTFNPHSFCEALHHSDNHGQCCNLQGVSFEELDEMLDNARYGTEVADDPDLRRERYDEIWHYLAELSASSITHFDLATAVMNNDVQGFEMWPFNEGILSYNLYSPQDEQVISMAGGGDADDGDD